MTIDAHSPKDVTLDDYDALSVKAARVIGHDLILAMSDAQAGLLNKALDRLLLRRGSVEAVTDAEIEGQYEQIVMYVLPTEAHEHLLE
jgi:hypothetical protein